MSEFIERDLDEDRGPSGAAVLWLALALLIGALLGGYLLLGPLVEGLR